MKKKILIISFDNRKTLNYLEDHNMNIIEYCKKHKNIFYEFIDKSDKNVYWSKIYLLIDKLNTNMYDYVMWLDTDAMIVKQEIDLKYVLSMFNSEILISHENDYFKNLLNAGVIIIKQSNIGKEFLNEILKEFENSKCVDHNNKLNGIYGMSCYEQGLINKYIINKYIKNTTVLSNNIIFNRSKCDKNTFILHNYGSPNNASIFNYNTDIKRCYKEIKFV